MQDVHATLGSHGDAKQYWKLLLKFKTAFIVSGYVTKQRILSHGSRVFSVLSVELSESNFS